MSTTSLAGLVSQMLIGLSKDYQRHDSVPTIPLWSNFLRVVPDEGLKRSDLAPQARISRRAVSAILTGAGQLASVEQGFGRGGSMVRLTDTGVRARDNGARMLATTQDAWLSKLGEIGTSVQDQLRTLVPKIALELPHFPLGYGPVDDSMTGGNARPGRSGPPWIPPHGSDWVPVVREQDSAVDDLPLTALLSQVLVAFAIDFEQENASLPTTLLWREFPDEGLPARALPGGCPNPSGWERHGLATIDPTPLRKTSVVTLTAPARSARDRYEAQTAAIEEQWSHRFGGNELSRLRNDLAAVIAAMKIGHLPHFPRVTWVGGLR